MEEFKSQSLFKFSALQVSRIHGRLGLSVENSEINSIESDEVVVKVHYSSVNYKDRLIALGNVGLIRKYPHIVGIDAVGTIACSNGSQFSNGQEVMLIATPLGVETQGGFAEYVKVPVQWLMDVPHELSLKDIASFGTAGYTAALAVLNLKKNNVSKDRGLVLVTGCSGGVGLIAAYILLVLGYRVELVSKEPAIMDVFSSFEHVSHTSYSEFVNKNSFPLLKPKYTAVIDTVGGEALSVAIRSLEPEAMACVIGMAASETLNVSIMPFILRGIHCVGINAESSHFDTREAVWRLLSEVRPSISFEKFIHEFSLREVCKYLSSGSSSLRYGRIVVKI